MEKQSPSSSTTKFYSTSLALISATLPLPPVTGVNYEILSNLNDGMMISVTAPTGETSFSEVRYITASGNTVKYSGSFMYQTDGVLDATKTVVVPGKEKVHLGYKRGNNEWQVYYTLSDAPIWTVGYISGATAGSCAEFTSVNFESASSERVNMQAVDTTSTTGKIVSYWIDTTAMRLNSDSTFSLTGFLKDDLKVFYLPQSENYLIVGNSSNATTINLRNVNQLSKLLYSATTTYVLPQVVTGGFDTQGEVGVVAMLDFGAPKSLRFSIDSNTGNPLALSQTINYITQIGVCPSCELITFTGLDATQTAVNRVYVQSYTASPATASTINTTCTPERVFLSNMGARVAWTCSGTTLYVAQVGATGSFFEDASFEGIKSAEFVDESSVVVSDQNKVHYVSLPIATVSATRVGSTTNSDDLVAVDPTSGIYVTASDTSPGVLTFHNSSGTATQTFTLSSVEPIASLTYSTSG